MKNETGIKDGIIEIPRHFKASDDQKNEILQAANAIEHPKQAEFLDKFEFAISHALAIKEHVSGSSRKEMLKVLNKMSKSVSGVVDIFSDMNSHLWHLLSKNGRAPEREIPIIKEMEDGSLNFGGYTEKVPGYTIYQGLDGIYALLWHISSVAEQIKTGDPENHRPKEDFRITLAVDIGEALRDVLGVDIRTSPEGVWACTVRLAMDYAGIRKISTGDDRDPSKILLKAKKKLDSESL